MSRSPIVTRPWPILVVGACLLLACANAREPAAERAGRGDADSLSFRVRGGIAGFDLELVVTGGAHAELVSRGEIVGRRELTAAERRSLARRVPAARPGFAHTVHGRGGQVADGWWRAVRFRGAGESWAIEEQGGPEDPLPAAARQLFDQLMELAVGMLTAGGDRPAAPPR